jgi:hypothetical protein
VHIVRTKDSASCANDLKAFLHFTFVHGFSPLILLSTVFVPPDVYRRVRLPVNGPLLLLLATGVLAAAPGPSFGASPMGARQNCETLQDSGGWGSFPTSPMGGLIG